MMIEKIPIRKIRSSLETINVSVAFLRQNFKPIFKTLAILSLPLIFIGMIANTLFTFSFMNPALLGASGAFESDPMDFINMGMAGMLYFFLFLLLIFLGAMSFTATIYGYLQLYLETDDISNISLQAVIKRAFRDTWILLGASMILMFVFFLAIIPLSLLMIIPGLGILLFFGGFIYLGVTLSMVFIIQLIERINIFDAIGRSFRLIQGHWWSTFGLNMVLWLMLTCLTITPYLVVMLFMGGSFFILDQATIGNALWVKLIVMVVQTIAMIAYILPNALYLLGIAFRYFSLVELKEGTGMLQQIQQLDKMNDETDATFDGRFA